jgi:hypothetical protein
MLCNALLTCTWLFCDVLLCTHWYCSKKPDGWRGTLRILESRREYVRLYRKALLATEQQSKALISTSGHSSVLSKEEQVTATAYYSLLTAV